MTILLVVLAVLYVGGFLLDLVGRFFCLAVPSTLSSARALIITSLVFQIVSLLLNIINVASGPGGMLRLSEAASLMVMLGAGVSGVVAMVLFILFIRNVCQHIRRYDLAERAMMIIRLSAGCVIGYVLVFVVILAAALVPGKQAAGGMLPAIGFISTIVMVAIMIVALGTLILYAMLLSGSSAAVRRYTPRRSTRRRAEYDDDDDDDDDDDEPPRRRKRRKYDDDDDDFNYGGNSRRWERG